MRLQSAENKSKLECDVQCQEFWSFVQEWHRVGQLKDQEQPYETSVGIEHVVSVVGARPFVTERSSMRALLLVAMKGASLESQLLACYLTGIGVSFDRFREYVEQFGILDWQSVPDFIQWAQGRKLWKVGRRSPGLSALTSALQAPMQISIGQLDFNNEQRLWQQVHSLPLVGAYRAVTICKSLRTLGLISGFQFTVLGSGAKRGLALLKPCKLGDLLSGRPEGLACDALDIEFWLCYYQAFRKHSS